MSIALTMSRSAADGVLRHDCRLAQMPGPPPQSLDPGIWVAIGCEAGDGLPARLVAVCHILGWLHRGECGDLLQSHHWRPYDGSSLLNLDAHGDVATEVRYENMWNRRPMGVGPISLDDQVSRWWTGDGCAWLITGPRPLPRAIPCEAGPADAFGLWVMPDAARLSVVDQMGWSRRR